ncbi:MAG: molybdopterin-dependent oxidoreductase [Xanthobacteraceae bacterium]|nr:molybdopterin-dependent oxidoreductase [Xanthobacteraceae bacterium]
MGQVRRVPHCSHWGAYTILVEDGAIVGIEPFARDPAPSPIIQSVRNWIDPSRRVARPMVRAGWLRSGIRSDRAARGRDRFVAVDWDTALGLVADEIRRVSATNGNAAIFAGSYGWTSCGRFHHASSLLKRTLNLVGGYTGHVDTYSIAAGPVILRHTLGSDDACGGRANTLDDVAEHADTLVVFGAMSPRTAQNEAGGIGRHALETYLRRMVARGVRVVLVSPLKDDLPDWVAAEWWPIRPNTDTALMIALAGETVKAGRQDRDFLARCCSGVDRFTDYLAGRTDGVVKDAAWAAAITGLNADAIRDLALRLATTRSMLSVSWSLQRAHHGEQPFWAALGLAAVNGQIGLPGGGVGYGYGSLGGVGAPFAVAKSPAISQFDKAIDSFIPVARITDLLLKPGARFDYQGKTHTYPDIRMVYWAGGNPFHHQQDINRLAEGWTRPETIVVQEPMWTATAQRADIVLPASTSIERNDLAGNRRSDVIVAMHKAIEPLAEARSDFDIFNGLAERLGVGRAFNEGRGEMEWIRYIYDLSRADAASRFNHDMPDFETFWRQGYAEVPTRPNNVYLAEFRDDPDACPLATESGRIVLGSEMLARLNYDDCRSHPAWLPPAEWLGAPAAVRERMMHLISHQPAGRLHSQLEAAPESQRHKRNGREQARMHPTDAHRLGISDGQTVRLWNERGECLATATLTEAVRESVVVLPTGAWLTPASNSALDLAGNPNVLTLDVPTSQFGQGCSAHTCLVHVEPFIGVAENPIERYQARIASLIAE